MKPERLSVSAKHALPDYLVVFLDDDPDAEESPVLGIEGQRAKFFLRPIIYAVTNQRIVFIGRECLGV
jgi:hypothetical protein